MIARDSLVKTALFGSDPNWGRVLAAVGMAPVDLDPDRITVSFNGFPVCIDGVGAPGAREVDLSGADIDVTVDLGVGDGAGDHPHHRPVARLRRRELGLQLMTATRRTTDSRPQVLAEALPWLKQLHGKIVVVKYGGNAMTDDTLKAAFAADMVFLRNCGIHPVVVHGGGPQISAMLQAARYRRRFQGRLPGHHAGGARRRADGAVRPGRPRTGQPDQRPRPVRRRHHRRGRPAVHRRAAQRHRRRRGHRHRPGRGCRAGQHRGGAGSHCGRPYPGGLDASRPTPTGVVHNINADTAAAALAEALGAEKLLMLTDVEGLYTSWPDRDSLVSEIDTATLTQLLPTLEDGHDPQDRGLPAGRRRAACPARTSSTAGSNTACWSSCSPTRVPARRW